MLPPVRCPCGQRAPYRAPPQRPPAAPARAGGKEIRFKTLIFFAKRFGNRGITGRYQVGRGFRHGTRGRGEATPDICSWYVLTSSHADPVGRATSGQCETEAESRWRRNAAGRVQRSGTQFGGTRIRRKTLRYSALRSLGLARLLVPTLPPWRVGANEFLVHIGAPAGAGRQPPATLISQRVQQVNPTGPQMPREISSRETKLSN